MPPLTLDDKFQALVDAQAANTAALKALLARDPRKEFGNWEGNVGSDPERISYNNAEGFRRYLIPTVAFPTQDFATNIDTYGCRIRWKYCPAAAATQPWGRRFLNCQFSKTKDFRPNSTFSFQSFPVVRYAPTSFVVATGVYTGEATLIFDDYIPVKYRYLRVELWVESATPTTLPVKDTNTISGTWGGGYASFLEAIFYGE